MIYRLLWKLPPEASFFVSSKFVSALDEPELCLEFEYPPHRLVEPFGGYSAALGGFEQGCIFDPVVGAADDVVARFKGEDGGFVMTVTAPATALEAGAYTLSFQLDAAAFSVGFIVK